MCRRLQAHAGFTQGRIREAARKRMQQLIGEIESASQGAGAGAPPMAQALTAQLEAAVQGLSQGLIERDTEVRLAWRGRLGPNTADAPGCG